MPAMKCSECGHEWDADDADEPAPDHGSPDGESACPGSGEPGECAACGAGAGDDPCDECSPHDPWLAHPIV